MTHINKQNIIFILSFILFFVFYRFWGIGEYFFWQDELALYSNSQRPFANLIQYCLNFSYHPPVFYLFNKLVISFTGFNEIGIRGTYILISLFGSLVPWLFRKTLGERVAFFCSMLQISNSVLIQFSQDALVYSLVTSILTVFICLLHSFVTEQKRNVLISLILVCVLISYLNYFALALVSFSLLFTIIQNYQNQKIFKSLSLCLVLLFVCYLPWILNNHLFFKLFASGQKNLNFWNEKQDLFQSIRSCLYFIFSKNPIYLLTYVCLCAYGFIKNKNRFFRLYLIQFLFLALFYTFTLHKLGALVDKYFLLLIPYSLFVLSWALEVLKNKIRISILILCGLITLFGSKEFNIYKGYQDLKPVIKILNKSEGKVHLLVYNYNWYKPYFENLKPDVHSIDIHCDKKKEFIQKFSKGDLLVNISDQCDLDSILDKLDKNNIDYKTEYYINGVKIIKLIY